MPRRSASTWGCWPTPPKITSSQRFVRIQKIAADALWNYLEGQIEDLALAGFVEQIQLELDAIKQDPILK